MSARTTYLFRQNRLNPDLLTRSERGMLRELEELFVDVESMDMTRVMPLNRNVREALANKNLHKAEHRSGIAAVETMIDDYINKYNLPYRVSRAYDMLKKIIVDASNENELDRNLQLSKEEFEQLSSAIAQLKAQEDKGFATQGFIDGLKNKEIGLSDKAVAQFNKGETKVRMQVNDFGRRFSGKSEPHRAEQMLSDLQRDVQYAFNNMMIEYERIASEESEQVRLNLEQEFQRYIVNQFSALANEQLKLPALANLSQRIQNLGGKMFESSLQSHETKEKVREEKKRVERKEKVGWFSTWKVWTWGDEYTVDDEEIIEHREQYVLLDEIWQARQSTIYEYIDSFTRNIKEKVKQDSENLTEQGVRFMENVFKPEFDRILNELEQKVGNQHLLKEQIAIAETNLEKIQSFKEKLNQILAV
ncbi:hypothetical protein [Suttonella ornithocola]|uniref:hypothetical protein n=1 Tax=Suttonella ornithocola TaxID=279832 RepID=UPI001160BDDD|nr:hypothetical protein [Suttonella ornithocola]